MAFEPSDPNFESRSRENFLSQNFMRSIGATMSILEPGRCMLTIKFTDDLTQQHGFFHGGVIATIADVSGGYAAFSLLPQNRTNLTVELKLNILSPGQGESLTAEAVVLKPGRTLTVCRSDVHAISPDGSRKLCATALATYMAVDLK